MTGGAPHEFAFWQKVCDDFSEKSGVTVTLIRSASQTEQRKQQITVGLRGKERNPDVFLMDIAWIGQLAWSGWLEPLDKHGISAEPYFKNIIELADMHNGSLIGLPVFVDAGLLYYRKDLLEKHGYSAPPATWNELVEMATKIQEIEKKANPDFWGFVWQGAQYEGLVCNALEYFTSAGGGYFDNNSKPIISSAENARALRFMSDLIHTYKISPPNTFTDMKEEESRMPFQNGNALFERNWPYALNPHSEDGSAVQGKFDFTVLPHFEGQKSAAALGGWHAGVSKFSDCTKDAAAFAQYLASYEIQKRMALTLGHNPGRPDVFDDEEVKKTPVGGFKDMFYAAIPRPPVPYYSQVSNVLQKYINAAIAAKMPAEQALEQAQKEIEKITSDYKQ